MVALGTTEASGSGFDDYGASLQLHKLDLCDGSTSSKAAGVAKTTSRFVSLAWSGMKGGAGGSDALQLGLVEAVALDALQLVHAVSWDGSSRDAPQVPVVQDDDELSAETLPAPPRKRRKSSTGPLKKTSKARGQACPSELRWAS